jgi:hypothetical protein
MPGKSWRYAISNNRKLPFPARKVLRNRVTVGIILHQNLHFETSGGALLIPHENEPLCVASSLHSRSHKIRTATAQFVFSCRFDIRKEEKGS